MVQGEHFDLIVYPNKGLLFSDDQVVFTKDATFPMLEEEQIREMLRMRDNTIKKLIISAPYKPGSIKQIFYIIAGNYLHLILHGSITSSFDESEVKFARFSE